ncbi:manganese-dependent inorganic pyrophosphatase [Lactobacillus acetotolerans]|uniref:Probable manganese-dependent inorganic pyrophosphatase n=1 Tax=Lactobacillus acetotolerans TaxID=1600 RepID=A0A5P5ZI33_9LACO|nr:manganese-dependent inorganic pyrophosphatase [Lactobacillus acetotolerans]KRN39534.1 inorganic diphosphatase PpaC [Lactobacillus acetotolerans DSM 20749 = JCM 3825]QFG51327.1 manganese-dependent inorganic pyrophosphatase [Lactobacillus acetotolerans]QGV04560.1 manganese-dependent inorganic pyrophosphatase [Lactobacillus acetotolerans]GGV16732.1 putative manganese-dependent inorganic pyrophosphatase [Lactobacillus acetotolerans DSM 20749 = JCM 3825]HBG91258.1 manganese-dependent inorganic p
MEKELVFGHQSPDTDAIGTAIAFSYLQNKLGYNTEPVALAKPNDETAYALKKFGFKAPRVIKTASNEVNAVMLVDHNEPQQSVSDIDKVKVTHVVDHHRIMNFNTTDPIYYRAEPMGCTSTIVWKMYHENGIEIPQNIAGIMLSAIISDTLLLKSPTTTDYDHKAVKSLAKIAGVDYEDYGLKELKAGTNIDNKTEDQLISGDAKSFKLSGNQVRVAQVNVVDLPDAMKRKDAFLKAMDKSAKENNYDLFMLLITNILDSDSDALVVGSDSAKAAFEKAFGKKLDNSEIKLPGVVSRKKQVVPPLTEAFK